MESRSPTRISPVTGFLSQYTRWSWDLNLGLCDPKSQSKEGEPSSPQARKHPPKGLGTELVPLPPMPEPGKCC